MLEEVKKSLKAKLYDLTYSPFMSSLIIAWAIVNHKYILIYISTIDIDQKIKMLNEYCFGDYYYKMWFLPLVTSLFYVYVYPLISKHFYSYTLHRKRELKELKSSIEDETPLTKEESKEYRTNFHVMNKKLDETMQELVEQKRKFEEELKIQIQAEKKFLEEKYANAKAQEKEKAKERLKIFSKYRNRYVEKIQILKMSKISRAINAVSNSNETSETVLNLPVIVKAGNTRIVTRTPNKSTLSIDDYMKNGELIVLKKSLNLDKEELEKKCKEKELLALINGNFIIVRNSGFTYDELTLLYHLYLQNTKENIFYSQIRDAYGKAYGISAFKFDKICQNLEEMNLIKVEKNSVSNLIQIKSIAIDIFLKFFED